MPFMVIYRTSDGSSSFEQAEAIDEAALFVEQLRNKEGIDQIRIYRMEEISFAFRPYYKVELGMAERQSTPTPPSASTAVVIEVPQPEPEAAEPVASKLPPPPGAPELTADPQAADVAAVHTEAELPDAELDDEGQPAGANGRRGLFGR
jgi:hypothetical protein